MPPSHPDYGPITDAYDQFTEKAAMLNEKKREAEVCVCVCVCVLKEKKTPLEVYSILHSPFIGLFHGPSHRQATQIYRKSLNG